MNFESTKYRNTIETLQGVHPQQAQLFGYMDELRRKNILSHDRTESMVLLGESGVERLILLKNTSSLAAKLTYLAP